MHAQRKLEVIDHATSSLLGITPAAHMASQARSFWPQELLHRLFLLGSFVRLLALVKPNARLHQMKFEFASFVNIYSFKLNKRFIQT